MDGRDGELSGDGTKDNPYIITANYYYKKGALSKKQINGLNNAIKEYNNNGKVRSYKNNNGEKQYLRFNLSAKGVDDPKVYQNDVLKEENGSYIYFGNTIYLNNSDEEKFGAASGWRIDLNQTYINEFAKKNHVNENQLIKYTFMHEIGHNLGLDHNDDTSLMLKYTVRTQQDTNGNSYPIGDIVPKIDGNALRILVEKTNRPRVDSLGILRNR